MRVQFIHGLEGSPQGNKARMLGEHFETTTPAMTTEDFEGCVDTHARVLESFGPDVLVGSSFGGAVAVALLMRGDWRGPTLLLAQAAEHYLPKPTLPEQVRVWLVHASEDSIVDVEHSRRLVATGTPGLVRLIEVDDDHPLHASVAAGRLIEWVAALGADPDLD
jgi:predicted esterase